MLHHLAAENTLGHTEGLGFDDRLMSTSPGDLDRHAAAPPCSHTVQGSTCRVDLDWENNVGPCKMSGLNSHLPDEIGGLSELGCRPELLKLPADDTEKHSVADMNYILDYSLLTALQTEKSAELRIQAGKPEGQRVVAAGLEATLGNVLIDNPVMLQRDQTYSKLPTTHFRRHLLRCTVLEYGTVGRPKSVAVELLPVDGIRMEYVHCVDLLGGRQCELRARNRMIMKERKDLPETCLIPDSHPFRLFSVALRGRQVSAPLEVVYLPKHLHHSLDLPL